MDIKSFHSLADDTIYFKALNIEDCTEIHNYASDEEVSRFIGWNVMKTTEETIEFIKEMIKRENEGTYFYASVVLKSSGKVIGTVMLFNIDKEARHAEVGYVFDKNYWGKGYGTKAVALINDFAFISSKLNKLCARVVDANEGSSRILLRNGYELEGRLREQYYIQDKYYDSLQYAKFSHSLSGI
ncbi:MAG: acetyltransferase, ribosomal protein N-acetylase [Anaerocolumna sp.]|jgi:ribosomal-protein-alanine N-acetyltransferase|nr:acetyltransferase, ribosomal protein N-acetylase [Anaerocolumna sp.]